LALRFVAIGAELVGGRGLAFRARFAGWTGSTRCFAFRAGLAGRAGGAWCFTLGTGLTRRATFTGRGYVARHGRLASVDGREASGSLGQPLGALRIILILIAAWAAVAAATLATRWPGATICVATFAAGASVVPPATAAAATFARAGLAT